MVKDLAVIILDYVKLPALSDVRVWLIHDVSRTLVVHVFGTMNPIEVISLNLEIEHYHSQLKLVVGYLFSCGFSCRDTYAITCPLYIRTVPNPMIDDGF